MIHNKDFFYVPAIKPPRRGRPSGGLHLYTHPRLNAKLLSSDFNHIAVRLPHLTLIGVYFKPASDLDDIIMCLATALNHASSSHPILIGGDFNLRPDSVPFAEVTSFLSHYGLSIASDITKPTYTYSQGSSCLDYIFASRSLKFSQVSLLDVSCSDHHPLQIKTFLPRHMLKTECVSSPPSRLDLDSVVNRLSHLDPTSSPDILTSQINSIFSSSSRPSPIRKTPKKPWFSSHSYSLRCETKRLLRLSRNNPAYNLQYTLTRKAYHSHLRSSHRAFLASQQEAIVASSLNEGLPGLFKHTRVKSSGSSIPLPDLLRYSKDLFSSASPSDNEFIPIPSCEDPRHVLLFPFSLDNILGCLKNLRSKAPSAFGPHSPFSLKLIAPSIAPLLLTIFNHALSTATFPSTWLETVMFFLHKKGDRSLPSNYRTIAIQNPFLKVFMSLLTSRMSHFSEHNNLLPDLQFGFRPSRNCLSAASLLFHTAFSRLSEKKRTYVAFIDFTKAFDTVNRSILFTKLQILGFPQQICSLLSFILKHLDFRIRQNSLLSPPFRSEIGTPQGDPLSPLLFSLYISDLPAALPPSNVVVPGTNFPLPTLLYADDSALLSDSPDNLQSSLDHLFSYCSQNCLSINISKSKILIFHKGRLPPCSFSINHLPLERVNEFQYLGIIFSSHLSFSKHISYCISKANSRIGFLLHSLPLKKLPLSLVLKCFFCFIFPIFTYGCHLWLSSFSNSVASSLNAVFTKFLKRYLCLPLYTSNSLTHFFSQTQPLLHSISHFAANHPLKTSFPSSLSGLQLPFLTALHQPSDFSIYSLIPSTFWLSPVIHTLPLCPSTRRSLLLPLVSPFFPSFVSN